MSSMIDVIYNNIDVILQWTRFTSKYVLNAYKPFTLLAFRDQL